MSRGYDPADYEDGYCPYEALEEAFESGDNEAMNDVILPVDPILEWIDKFLEIEEELLGVSSYDEDGRPRADWNDTQHRDHYALVITEIARRASEWRSIVQALESS